MSFDAKNSNFMYKREVTPILKYYAPCQTDRKCDVTLLPIKISNFTQRDVTLIQTLNSEREERL